LQPLKQTSSSTEIGSGKGKREEKNIRKVSQFSWKLKKASYLCTPLKRHCGFTVVGVKGKEDERGTKVLKRKD
jgi:hypothetical protein